MRRLESPREKDDSVSPLQLLRDVWRPDVRRFKSGLCRLPRRRSPPGHPDDLGNSRVCSECFDNTCSDVSRCTDDDDFHVRPLRPICVYPLSEPELSPEVAFFEARFESAEEPSRLGAVDQPVVIRQG